MEPRPVRIFVAMPGSTMGDRANWSDLEEIKQVLLQPVARRLGEELGRPTELVFEKYKLTSGPIHSSMFREAVDSDVYIADLTGANANVYLDLGFRWAQKDRVTILISQDINDVKLNASSNTIIPYGPLPRQLERAVSQIVVSALSGLQNPLKIDSPVVRASSAKQDPATPPIASPYSDRQFSAREANLFISYSHRDERYREQLGTHLSGLRRQGVIADWHDRKIVPGQEWRDAIDQNLDAADCVVLLVSPDFLASDYCYSIEMQRTLEKHREGRAIVIPVIVRPADWQHTPLGELQALPKDAKPVVEWARRDRAWLNVMEGLRSVLALQG